MDETTFDPKTAAPQVSAVLARYRNALVYGGVPGGIPAAEWDCKQQLRRLGCDEAYIQAATAYTWNIGNAEWERLYRLGKR